MSRKSERQRAVTRLIHDHPVASQEELKRYLVSEGWTVTQATLSRDLRDLGVVRGSTDEGTRYLLPDMVGDDDKPSLGNLLPQWFSRISGVGELIVLHTLPSGAPPVAEAIDSAGWSEVLGTLAGENTVLIVCRSSDARIALAERIAKLAASE